MNLDEILEQHKLWLDSDGIEGERAYLPDANFTGADLRNANFTGADLTDAKLTGADLNHADLTDARISEKNLAYALKRGGRKC